MIKLDIFQTHKLLGGKLFYPDTVSQQVRCLLVSHPGTDRKPSARLYPDSDSVYCFVCGGPYQPLDYYSKVKGISKDLAREELARKGYEVPDQVYFKTNTKIEADKLRILGDMLKEDETTAIPEIRKYYGELDGKT